MTEGWFRLWRSLLDKHHHLAGDEACRRWAWVDLIGEAAWRPYTRMVGPVPVPLERGEFVGSVRHFAGRWRWSRSRVQRFLASLEGRKQIETVRGTPVGAVYRVVNYDTYQGDEMTDGTPDGTDVGQAWDKVEEEQEYSTALSLAGARKLADWLGEDGPAVVGLYARSADHGGKVFDAIYFTFAKGSMVGERIWSGVPESERPSLLAEVMVTLAGEGMKYHGTQFRRTLQTVIGDAKRSDGGSGAGPAGGKAPAARRAGGLGSNQGLHVVEE